MRLVLLLALVAACASPSPTAEVSAPLSPAMTAESTMTLFDFDGPDAPSWEIENDGVMGGHSQGFVQIEDETMVFTGEVVTQDGGFTSIRGARAVDLSAYDGIELRVRGSGRTFELDVDDGTLHRGREVNRQSAFPTTSDWATVRIPFDGLKTTAHGDPVTVDALDRAAIQTLGIYIIDGIDGSFRLEVDWIRAYAS